MSSRQYKYLAFGIRFMSDIALPELLSYTRNGIDVEIKYGDVPKEIRSPNEQNKFFEVAKNEFLLRIDGVANYYVANGEQIIVQLFNRDSLAVRLYLLGTVMGVLLMQRQVLPLHGSAVVVEGMGVIFLGDSGAGKSTLAAALCNKGHSLLADDISAVELDENGLPIIHSGYPQQKLWQMSAAMLGIDTSSLNRICKEIDKFVVPSYRKFWGKSMPIHAIYEIQAQAMYDYSIIPIVGVEKIAAIMYHTYRSEIIDGLGIKLKHFQSCTTLTKNVPVFRLTRPKNGSSLDQQVDVLQRHLAEQFGICNKPLSG